MLTTVHVLDIAIPISIVIASKLPSDDVFIEFEIGEWLHLTDVLDGIPWVVVIGGTE
jgi:hypothetical protein